MLDRSTTYAAEPGAELLPPDIWKRQSAKWPGLQVDLLEVKRLGCEAEAQFHGSRHLLIASEVFSTHKCETSIEGLPKSTLRNFSRKLTFIPAGHRFDGWAKVRTPLRAVYVYLDPDSPILPREMRFSEKELKPIMSFTDRNLWATAIKLKRCVERPQEVLHAEALELMLAYELLSLDKRVSARVAKGGLDARLKERVAGYIEEHLAEHISLLTLAQIAGLSTDHFTRAFKFFWRDALPVPQKQTDRAGKIAVAEPEPLHHPGGAHGRLQRNKLFGRLPEGNEAEPIPI